MPIRDWKLQFKQGIEVGYSKAFLINHHTQKK
jgi:hypothetical protein